MIPGGMCCQPVPTGRLP